MEISTYIFTATNNVFEPLCSIKIDVSPYDYTATIIEALVSVMATIDDQIFKYWQYHSTLLRCNNTQCTIQTYYTILLHRIFCTSVYFSYPHACACAILGCCPAKLILFAWHNYISTLAMFVCLSSSVALLADCCRSMWGNLQPSDGYCPEYFVCKGYWR